MYVCLRWGGALKEGCSALKSTCGALNTCVGCRFDLIWIWSDETVLNGSLVHWGLYLWGTQSLILISDLRWRLSGSFNDLQPLKACWSESVTQKAPSVSRSSSRSSSAVCRVSRLTSSLAHLFTALRGICGIRWSAGDLCVTAIKYNTYIMLCS